MKFLVIDDEHELYRVMMNDLFTQTHYQVEEVKRVEMPSIVKKSMIFIIREKLIDFLKCQESLYGIIGTHYIIIHL